MSTSNTYSAVRPYVHPEGGSHALRRERDGGQTSRANGIVILQRVQDILDVVVELLKLAYLLYLMGLLDVPHNRIELRIRFLYAKP